MSLRVQIQILAGDDERHRPGYVLHHTEFALENLSLGNAQKIAVQAGFMYSSADDSAHEAAQARSRATNPPDKLYTLMIESVGDKKVHVIREVRRAAGYGLAEAKALVEAVEQHGAKHLLSHVKQDDANNLREIFEGEGATVRLVPMKEAA